MSHHVAPPLVETVPSDHTHLFDHDAAEVTVLEGGEGRVLLSQNMGQLHIHLVQLIHLLQ